MAIEATRPVDTVHDIGNNVVLAQAGPGHLKSSFEASVSQVTTSSCLKPLAMLVTDSRSPNFRLTSDSERN